MAIEYLTISYPDFVLGQVIDPEEIDQNNMEIVNKINEVVTTFNDMEEGFNKAQVDSDNAVLIANNAKAIAQNALDSVPGEVATQVQPTIDIANNAKAIAQNALDSVPGEVAIQVQPAIDIANNAKATAQNALDIYEDLIPYLNGGDTLIKYEVFEIVNPNDGAGNFTYKDKDGVIKTGTLTDEGHQVFTLSEGEYIPNENRIEATINDTLHRSKASGGLREIDATHVALTIPEGAGAEITFKYYERVGIIGTGLIVVSKEKPPDNFFWFKVVE